MTGWAADVRNAARALLSRPAYAAALVLTLGLGIGATTTIYSFVYALLLRPYPYASPESLVRVQSVYQKEGGARRGMSLRDIEDYRRDSKALAGIGAYSVFDTRLLTDGAPVVVSAAQIEADALRLLGVTPQLGRLFLPDEDRPGGDVNKALIAHDLWQTQFGRDPAIVGKPLRTDRLTYTIVGVMPPGFAFPDRVAAWMPMESYYQSLPADDARRTKWRGGRWYATVGRLAPGRPVAAAADALNSAARALERAHPVENDGVSIALTPLREFETGPVRAYLLVCLSGVVLVLLICCANVASLMLVRTAARRREIAVMASLGASTGRIVRSLFAESLAVGLAGATCGAAIGWIGVQGLMALIPVDLPAWIRVEVGGPVLAVTAALGVGTALLFGLAPITAGWRIDLARALRDGARGSTRSPVRASLVVGEIALSVVLLVSAGLLMRTFLELQRRHPGFRPEGVVAARAVLWAPGSRQASAAALAGIHDRVLAALKALPGVRSAAVTNYLPYAGTTLERSQSDIFIKGRAARDTKTLAPISGADVSPDYFATMRIPLVRGRLFEPTDTTQSEPVVVISERAATLFFRDQDPIGQYVSWGEVSTAQPWTRVVGVVGNVKHHAAEGDVGVEFYYPVTQWPVATSYYVVRTDGDPDAYLDGIRRTVVGAEPGAAIASIKTVERTMTESLWQRRLWGVLFAGFAGLALLLAAVGVYGVISYSVAQRTREMGVRLALGATPAAVRGLVVRESMTLCVIGAVFGIVVALALGQVARTLLFGVTPYDTPTYATVLAVLFATVGIASWLPARRASRVSPTVALRAE
jgi:putative ABC transport system permease protein